MALSRFVFSKLVCLIIGVRRGVTYEEIPLVAQHLVEILLHILRKHLLGLIEGDETIFKISLSLFNHCDCPLALVTFYERL